MPQVVVSCRGLAQGEKHHSSRVVLIGRDLDGQAPSGTEPLAHKQHTTIVRRDLIGTALIFIHVYRSNQK
jgi:hypothetical protein